MAGPLGRHKLQWQHPRLVLHFEYVPIVADKRETFKKLLFISEIGAVGTLKLLTWEIKPIQG